MHGKALCARASSSLAENESLDLGLDVLCYNQRQTVASEGWPLPDVLLHQPACLDWACRSLNGC